MSKPSILLATVFAAFTLLLSQNAMAESVINWVANISYRNMNPASNYGSEIYVLGNVYETLFHYKDGKVLPNLATSWEKSNNGKTWTVTLRKGVKFQDGSPFDAAAVKKSFEYTRDLGKGAGFLYAGLETVETPDRHTAVFQFKDPTALDLVASGQYGSYLIAPAAIDKGDEWMKLGNAIGTGPYKLTKFEQGKLLVLDKFDEYWGGWEPGQVDRAIHPYVNEASTRVQMVRSGEADIARVPAAQMENMSALPDVSVTNSPGWRNQFYMINTQKYPTDNIKFRQALVYLWDHDTVLKDIFQGAATRPVAPIPATMWGHGKYDTGTYDPQKALELLEKSGVPKKDWKIKAMFSNSNQEQRDAIELFQANAAAVGVEVELELHKVSTTYMTNARNLENSGHLNSMVWWPAYPTPSDWMLTLFKTEKKPAWNLSYYYNEEFDRLADKAVEIEGIDVKASEAAYIAAQDKLMQDVVGIFYADVNRVDAYSSDIKNMEAANNAAYESLFLYKLRK